MKKYLKPIIVFNTTLLVSCAAYKPPTEGELATLILTNYSSAKTQVDYCHDKFCKETTRITTLKKRDPYQINIYANRPSYIRFFTKLYVSTFDLTPGSKVVNKKFECEKIVTIEPEIDLVYKLNHLFKSNTGQCNVQVN